MREDFTYSLAIQAVESVPYCTNKFMIQYWSPAMGQLDTYVPLGGLSATEARLAVETIRARLALQWGSKETEH